MKETTNFFVKVYGWMFLGLVITGVVAYIVSLEPSLYKIILWKPVFISLAIGAGLLGYIVNNADDISARLAPVLFVLCCFAVGLFSSIIFLLFTIKSIGMTFLIAAGMFGITSVYGYFTKSDLTGSDQILKMGFLGLSISMLANAFFDNSAADYTISFVGVVIFTGMTAFYTQKIKDFNVIGNEGTLEDQREAIRGALMLYFAFLNLFAHLLRFFGRRR